MWKRLKDFILQDVNNENEIKMHAVILRMGLLVMVFYHVISAAGAAVMRRPGAGIAAASGLLLCIWLFRETYRDRTRFAAYVFLLSFTLLILVSVLLHGNATSVFHFMYVQIVLLYALDYMRFCRKIFCAVLLVVFRIWLYSYVDRIGSVYAVSSGEKLLWQGLHIAVTCMLLLVIVSASTQDFREMQEKLVSYNRKLKDMAGIDPLTGLHNRRSTLEYIKEKEENYRSGKATALTIAIGDIDFFKKINDTYGHNQGDEVLRILADMFQAFMQGKGRVARWGGEEFLFVFHDINGDDASNMLVELRKAIHHIRFRLGGDLVRITMTFGVAEYDLRMETDAVINEADQKLYLGKESGRDRIVY